VTLPLTLLPRFRGHSPAIPVVADPAAITAGRFVKITGKNTAGAYKARHCTAGERPTGVAERSVPVVPASGPTNNNMTNTCGPGAVAFVEAGAAVTVDDPVTPDAVGRAVPVGAPASASLTTGVVASENAIVWTAEDAGTAGNDTRIQLRDPAGNTQTLSVDVDGDDVIVNLATDGAGAITSTAALVIAAVNEDNTASQKVGAANAAGSDGTGVVAAVALTNLAGGTAGTNAFPAGVAETAAAVAGDIIEVRLI
jgi:hypothetical protein